MRAMFGWLPSVVLASTLLALHGGCDAPQPGSRPLTCNAGDPGCPTPPQPEESPDESSRNSGTQIGTPEPALPEDQYQPPASATKTTHDAGAPDSGSTSVVNVVDAGGTLPPVPPPTLDASNACWSQTLMSWVELNGCYQRIEDGMWFQCGFNTPTQSNAWFRYRPDASGHLAPVFGPCSSAHPLQQ
jgi:hypothetical protein